MNNIGGYVKMGKVNQSFETTGTEEEFLSTYTKVKDTYEKPSVTTDMVAFRFKKISKLNSKGNTEDRTLAQVLMVRRANHPYQHKLAFPGGFLDMGETLEQCAKRELLEETGVDLPYHSIEQLGIYSEVNRDPRMRILTVPYLMYLPKGQPVTAGDDAQSYEWVTIQHQSDGTFKYTQIDDEGNRIQEYQSSDFSFDHLTILNDACQRIQGRLSYHPTILNIFNGRGFTIREAKDIYGCFDARYLTMTQSNFKRHHVKYFSETEYQVERLKRPANVYEYHNAKFK